MNAITFIGLIVCVIMGVAVFVAGVVLAGFSREMTGRIGSGPWLYWAASALLFYNAWVIGHG